MTVLNSNVSNMIEIYKKKRESGEVFLSIKPHIDDISCCIAHVYTYGGCICQFKVDDGTQFQCWNPSYKKYSYGAFEFKKGRAFEYLNLNWDAIVKTMKNRAMDRFNYLNGLGDSYAKSHHNHYERMRENIIACRNYKLQKEKLAVIDMEYTVPLQDGRKAKADLIYVSIDDNNKIHFYVTEYKSTKSGFGNNNSLDKHYDDMAKYVVLPEIKEHLIKTLQVRVQYGLMDCTSDERRIVETLKCDDIVVELLFAFSNKDEMLCDKDIVKKLQEGYEYIKGKSLLMKAKYIYINDLNESNKLCIRDCKVFDGEAFVFE